MIDDEQLQDIVLFIFQVLKKLREPSVEFPRDFEEKYGNKILVDITR